jgi:DNA-binding transcriptional LysR family regulator
MHRRHAKKNVPIELLRAVTAIVDTGSFTKAADALDLTQSAISSQIARLGQLLGGEIFAKGPGIVLTKRGMMVLQYARRMLAINDELLSFTGPISAPRQLVIGLPTWLAQKQLIAIFERCLGGPTDEQVSFRCDRSEKLARELQLGSLDLAFLCNMEGATRGAVARWSEKMFWVKSPKLKLCPGAPIPLVGWPGSYPDRRALEALMKADMRFAISFSGPDFSCRLAAAVAGLGVFSIHERLLIPGVEIVSDGLPPLPDTKTGIYARSGLDPHRIAALLERLTAALAPPSSGPLQIQPEIDSPALQHTARDELHPAG